MGIEFELKFSASPQTLEQLARSVESAPIRIRMETTYYDTPSGALSAKRYTLRRRLENDRSVCTLKFPVDGPGRGEVEVESPSVEAALAQLALRSGKDLPALCAEGLIPVCGAKFVRRAFRLVWEDTLIELALDQGLLLGGGKELPLCEVEAELISGNPAAVQRFGVYLQQNYSLTPEPHSKFRRALALAKGESYV